MMMILRVRGSTIPAVIDTSRSDIRCGWERSSSATLGGKRLAHHDPLAYHNGKGASAEPTC